MTRPYTILALDLALTTGWAFASDGVIKHWGLEDFRVKTDDMWVIGDRLSKFQVWLDGFAGVDEVFYEIPGADLRNQAANANCYAMVGIVNMFCARTRAKMQTMHNSTLKKNFFGYGKATKEQMCSHARAMGWKGGAAGTDLDHDTADAIALIVCLLLERGIEARFA